MHRVAVGKRIELTSRDLELFKLLSRYRYLRSNFLYAFLGGASEKRFIERLGHLYHDGGYINRPAQQWDFSNCRYMPVAYELDEAGARALADHGSPAKFPARRRPCRQFAHALMVAEILASIELGVRKNRGLRFIPAEEIVAKAPDRTRIAPYPLEIPIAGAHGSKIVPDGLFGLEYGGTTYRFFALEADRDTMPCVRSDPRQSSVLRKLFAYRAIASERAYKAHWGIPNLLVLTVTTSEAHQRNIMIALGNELRGSTTFLFKAAPTFGSMLTAASPNFAFLKDPWLRVGHEPLTISA